MAKLPVGALPRPLIVRLLNYADRDAVRRAERKMKPGKHQLTPVVIFPDDTLKFQQQRCSLLEAETKLRAMGLANMLPLTSCLKALFQGQSLFFDTPEAVWSWIEERPPRPSSSQQSVQDDSNSGVKK
ncbi:hypothetical protein NDU88_004602 [Pleurodeles waltl]|uniref:Uncharacterized protein n=1 Tax=Pleurodeles waltl TaxID=8319 RepID=A0AAV7PEK0_PLEWA|nr:hypothetical protein NDU88_004602 [Pleurodeles waltl]